LVSSLINNNDNATFLMHHNDVRRQRRPG